MASDLDRVRQLLEEIARRHPDAREAVAEVEALLGRLPQAAPRPVRRRTGAGVRYEVRQVNRQPVLYEVRPAGAPLRIGKDLFDATVEVLAGAAKPLTYEDLAEGVEAAIGTAPADWQGRVVLRFLQQADPPVLSRSRSRYRPVNPAQFAAAARRLWNAAAKA